MYSVVKKVGRGAAKLFGFGTGWKKCRGDARNARFPKVKLVRAEVFIFGEVPPLALLAVNPNESWVGAFGVFQIVFERFCRGFWCDANGRFRVGIEVHIKCDGGMAERIILGFEFFIEEATARLHSFLKILVGIFAGGAISHPFVAIDERGSFWEGFDESVAEFAHEVAADRPEVETEEFDFWVFGGHGFTDEAACLACTCEVIFLGVLGAFPIGFGF